MVPAWAIRLSNYFRARRNRALVALIDSLAAERGAPLRVLDVGGSIIFWMSVPEATRALCRISLLNFSDAYDNLPAEQIALKDRFALLVGDARAMPEFGDGAFDLVVCNSVIEHVGTWADMVQAAAELKRVARHGWAQVPAFEFPIEQHWIRPFVHWFADPIQHAILKRVHRHYAGRPYDAQLDSIAHVRPLTKGQLRRLFPGARIMSEWLVFPKSHMAVW